MTERQNDRNMAFAVTDTDRLFADSPDVGDPDCLCSRCGELIPEDDLPIRMLVDGRYEYRFHARCLGLRFTKEEPDFEDDPREVGYPRAGAYWRKCRICGCTDIDCRQCIEKTGAPCYWVEPDLCSACAVELSR